jgi:putative methionine-R-sulfoxide reductase with GAF domain
MPSERLSELVADIVAQGGDRARHGRAIAEAIRADGGYRWVGVYEVDVEAGLVSNIAWSGAGPPEFPSFPATKGLTSRAIASGRTVNVGDVSKDPDYLTALATTRSEIIVPVHRDGRVVGTVDVESADVNAFDAAAQRKLEECAIALAEFCGARKI